MTTEHIKTRRKLKGITGIDEFNDILDNCVLIERRLATVVFHYV